MIYYYKKLGLWRGMKTWKNIYTWEKEDLKLYASYDDGHVKKF